MDSIFSKIWRFISDRLVGLRNVLRGFGRRLKRIPLAKLTYYGAVVGLLVILGSASYAYRNRTRVQPKVETPAQVTALAVQTPATMPTAEPTPEPMRFVWPVSGDVIIEYAPETLVWSPTLNQWQTHPALDLSALPGEAVAACADGVIDDAWQDPLWGNVIVIAHEEGYHSMYANLNTLNLVEVGDRVTAGEIISAVGQSSACEAETPWHLHFELQKDNSPVDFEALMTAP